MTYTINELRSGKRVVLTEGNGRALWLARALRARDIQRWWLSVTLAPITERACRVWNNIEIKCLKKAEEYK